MGKCELLYKRLQKNIIERFKEAGLGYADWNVSAEDSVGNPTPDSIMRNIRKDYLKYW